MRVQAAKQRQAAAQDSAAPEERGAVVRAFTPPALPLLTPASPAAYAAATPRRRCRLLPPLPMLLFRYASMLLPAGSFPPSMSCHTLALDR